MSRGISGGVFLASIVDKKGRSSLKPFYHLRYMMEKGSFHLVLFKVYFGKIPFYPELFEP